MGMVLLPQSEDRLPGVGDADELEGGELGRFWADGLC